MLQSRELDPTWPLLDRFRQAWAGPGKDWLTSSLNGLEPAIAKKVRLEQLTLTSILMPVKLLIGALTVLLIGYEYWRAMDHVLLGSFCGILLGFYMLLLETCRHYGFGRRIVVGTMSRLHRRYVVVTGLLGAGWGVLVFSLMRATGPSERSLLDGLVIGLMSTAVVSTPASVAIAFWLPVTLGGFAAVTFVPDARDFGTAALLAGYALLSLFCLLHLNRALIKRIVAEVRHSEGRETIDMLLRDFEDSAGDWLWETDLRGRLTHVSNRFAEAAGVPAAQLLGQELVAFIEKRRYRPRVHFGSRLAAGPELVSFMACQMAFRDVEVELEIGGQLVWWALAGKPRFSHHQLFEGFRGVGSDVTKAKLAHGRADYLAHFDELTGLANRRLFKEQLSHRLADMADGQLALLCLDLDGFKTVNDTNGHPVGDALLEAVAKRLQRQVRDGDLTARLGGDEFAVVVADGGVRSVERLANRLVAELSRPYVVDGRELQVGVSIGIAIANEADRSEELLLRDADAALYQAKADGKGTLRFYSQELRDSAQRRRTLEVELAQAIRADDLHLSYQPIFHVRSGSLHGVEALVRWNRTDGEALSPAEFVPLAENSRSIDDLGKWVLMRACSEAARLPRGTNLAVNVSALQLRGTHLPDYVDRALKLNKLDPRRLQLELTETAFIEMSDATLAMLNELHKRGIGISLDDFGVGNTSLNQLRRFPFSNIKIDRSFVQDLPGNPAARAIVKGLTCMAADMGMTVTAEGVETQEQLDLVRQTNCDFVQGFLLACPVDLPDIQEAFELGQERLVGRLALSGA